MSLKNSLDKLKQAIHAARPTSSSPIIPPGGSCNCCTVIWQGKEYCDCSTLTKDRKPYFGMRYDGPCGSRFPDCSCNGVFPTVVG